MPPACCGPLPALSFSLAVLPWARRFDDKLRMVSEYLLFRDTGAQLKRKIQAHFGGCWRRSGDLHEEIPLLESLPRHLRKMAYEQLATKAEKDVPFLKGLDADVVGRVYVLLDLVQFQPSDTIYKTREEGGEMFFVLQGTVDLKGGKGLISESVNTLMGATNAKSIYRPGDFTKLRSAERGGAEPYFGELSLFADICSIRTEDAVAKTNVDALVLSLQKLEHLRQAGPGGRHFYSRLFEFCRLQASRWGISNHSIQGHGKHQARGFPKIDQLCTEVRRDLMSRHVQILKDGAADGEAAATNPNLALSKEPSSDLIGNGGKLSKASPPAAPPPLVCEGATLVKADGELLHALPTCDKALAAEEQWRKCFVSIAPHTREVKYIVDEIGHLTKVCEKMRPWRERVWRC